MKPETIESLKAELAEVTKERDDARTRVEKLEKVGGEMLTYLYNGSDEGQVGERLVLVNDPRIFLEWRDTFK